METAEDTISEVPTTDDDWRLAENEATILAEAGDLMLIPSRIQAGKDGKTDDWIRITNLMTTLALEEKEAIRNKDGDKMFNIGARMYDEVCKACHEIYMESIKPLS